MGIWQTLTKPRGPLVAKAAPATEAKQQVARNRRGYEAANIGRTDGDWSTASESPKREVYAALPTLRARSRDLEHNSNEHRAFLRLVENNVIGPQGITLVSQAEVPTSRPNERARKTIESGWRDWGSAGECSADGIEDWVRHCKMILRRVACDGELLVRKVISPDFRYGLRLQPIEADYLPVDLIDTTRSGNEIRNGVEIDRWGRPVAYWLHREHPGDRWGWGGHGDLMRVPASEIIHVFLRERPGQYRGVPWTVSGMVTSHQIAKMIKAEGVRMRALASHMGFFARKGEGVGLDPGAELGDGEYDDDSLDQEFAAGIMRRLPDGYEFQKFDPQGNVNLRDNVKVLQRSMATGYGAAYHSLSGDLEGANYSSLRQGALDEREVWQNWQEWFAGTYCRPVYEAWLPLAIASGQVDVPFIDPDRLLKHTWRGRRWQWVDPLKEIQAQTAAIDAGLMSRQEAIQMRGRDPEEVFAEIAGDASGGATPKPPMQSTEGDADAEEQNGNGTEPADD